MAKVTVYVIRHGEKEDGKKLGISNDLTSLTPTGVQQVTESAKNNLSGIIPDALYCSLKYRAAQTVLAACSVLPNRNNGKSVIAHEGFDYSSAPNLNLYSQYTAEAKKRVEAGEQETVAMWLNIAPEMIGHLRDKMTINLIKVSQEVALNLGDRDATIIVGCHSPSSELATLDPKTMPMLKEADMVRYTVEVKFDDLSGFVETSIIASDYIPRGF